MIDFRYHLVSLIAVFLAVALGIVIGTTQLNGPVLTNLQDQVSALQTDKRLLEDETQSLQTQLDGQGGFAEQVGPALVAGTLTGRRVLLVVTDDGVEADVLDEVSTLLDAAGATVTGTLALEPAYTSPESASDLQAYVTGPGLPPGVTLPETDDTGELVAGLLAQVLVVPPGTDGEPDAAPDTAPDTAPDAAPDAAAASSVVAGLSALGVLRQESSSLTPADHVVLLTAGALTGDDAADRNAVLVQLATALDQQGSGAVIAGDAASAGDGGLVAAVRGDTTASAAISTVDNVTTPEGVISTVLALPTEGQGTSGKYGTGEDAQPVPPVPTP